VRVASCHHLFSTRFSDTFYGQSGLFAYLITSFLYVTSSRCLKQLNQTVRVKSLIINSSSSPSSTPKLIKLAVNRPSMGFGDIEDANEPAGAQILELSEEDVKEGKPAALKFVRFQSVNSLHVSSIYPYIPFLFVSFLLPVTFFPSRNTKIFIGSNHGGEDASRIDMIEIIGVPVEYVHPFYLLHFAPPCFILLRSIICPSEHLPLPFFKFLFQIQRKLTRSNLNFFFINYV
jgi:hypothetical protein